MPIDIATSTALKAGLTAVARPMLEVALAGLKSVKAQLLDVFTNRFAEYLTRQIERHKHLNTIVFGNQKLLEDLYIPLTVVPPDQLRGEGNSDRSITINRFDKKFIPEFKRVLITDTAGMGKSTLMKFLFLQCIRSCYAIPIFIELRHLSQTQGILDVLERELNNGVSSSAEDYFARPKIERLLKKGGLVFFLDGYDEIPFRDREKVTRDIDDVISSYPANEYAITSRPETGLPAFAGFRQFVIRPLKKEESMNLIRKYDSDGERSKLLISRLTGKDFQSVQEFLKNPLLTTLLYRCFEYKQNLPLKKHAFYRQVFDALFDWHDATKDGYNTREKKSKLDADGFHRILRVVGFISTTTGHIEGEADTILSWIRMAKEYCPGVAFSESDFLEDVTKAVPVFVVDGSHYRWAHKSLAEYFAAQYICNEGKRDQQSIFDAIRDGGRIGSFSNVLDQIYDLDNIAFRVYLVSPLAKAFSEFWDSQYKGMNPSIPVSMINLRKSAAFGDKCLINVRSRVGASKDIKLFATELLKEFESDDEIAIRIGFVRTDKQSMTIVNTSGPFAAILEILEEKKDPLVFDHTKKIQQFDEIKILSLKGLKKRNVSLPVNDDPQNALNSPNNFAVVTSIIAQHGPAVIDYDKMLSFARSCDAEPDKLQELGARLIQQMKEAAVTAK
jgi:hypothetical protein